MPLIKNKEIGCYLIKTIRKLAVEAKFNYVT
jgi:hypothetical protein